MKVCVHFVAAAMLLASIAASAFGIACWFRPRLAVDDKEAPVCLTFSIHSTMVDSYIFTPKYDFSFYLFGMLWKNVSIIQNQTFTFEGDFVNYFIGTVYFP